MNECERLRAGVRSAKASHTPDPTILEVFPRMFSIRS
jgi:hypothetical protein